VTWTNNGQVPGLAASAFSPFLISSYLPQNEYRSILNSVGFQEAPTGELLEREQKVLSRKKEAELIYDRLREPNEASKGSEQPGGPTIASAGDVDYTIMVNDHTSTDAEGEPDTTTSVPAVKTEKANGENTQKKEAEEKEKESPALEVSWHYVFAHATWAEGLAPKRKTMNSRSVIEPDLSSEYR